MDREQERLEEQLILDATALGAISHERRLPRLCRSPLGRQLMKAAAHRRLAGIEYRRTLLQASQRFTQTDMAAILNVSRSSLSITLLRASCAPAPEPGMRCAEPQEVLDRLQCGELGRGDAAEEMAVALAKHGIPDLMEALGSAGNRGLLDATWLDEVIDILSVLDDPDHLP